MKLSLKNNLQLGFGLSIGVLILSSLASFISIKSLIKNTELMTESHATISDLDNIISVLKDAETGQRGYLLTGNEVFLAPYKGSKKKVFLLYEKLLKNSNGDPVHQKKFEKLNLFLKERLDMLEQAIKIKKNKGFVSEKNLLIGKKHMDNVRRVIAEMQAEEKKILLLRSSRVNTWAGYTPILIIFASILSLLITFFFYRKVASDFNARIKLQQELQKINAETSNRIEAIKTIANQISLGNYKIRLEDQIKDDLGNLANSLNAMAESLQYSFGLLEDKEWLQSGIAKLNDQMVGEKDLETLANDMLIQIVQHTKSHVAALYVLEEDKGLFLTGKYALNTKKINYKIAKGEGLIGQCLQTEKLILLDEIPEGDITITYATGQTKPKNVVAFPLYHNSFVIGIIELGSLYAYTPRKLDFFRTIAGNIGVAIQVAQNRKKLQEFLEETQSQAEELQAQHNELEALNAELETHTQKIQASEEELRVQQEELLQSNQELEERTSLLEEKNQLIQERNIEIQQKAEQLAQSTRYKSEFLANMSHELRTPLNSILLLSRLMAENEELDQEYKEYADVIQSSGQGLLSLIDEILDLSKIEAGKMQLEIDSVNIEEVITDMRYLFNPLAREKNLILSFTSDKDVPSVIQTDKMRLEQILKNLLSNAFKFTKVGSISVSISLNAAQQNINFKVTDTGIGIANDKLEMIFEAFQQADGSTKRKFGGTGLGLSISKELARLLSGDIKVSSVENVGSEFILTIPLSFDENTIEQNTIDNDNLAEEKEIIAERYIVSHIPVDVADDRALLSAKDKPILIIEDDTAFAKTLLEFARKKGYKGIVAVRGDIGVELANQYKPLAILLDIQLPVKDGWQVMEELKANPATRAIPVHIMSSLEVKKESLTKGAIDFINKPVALEHMQQIFEKLEEALSKYPKKALIIEENEQHAKALSYFLSNANIQTQIAKNIKESLTALKEEEIDCVILDMGIPDKNTYDTLETFKKKDGLENLPIIVFTGKNLSKGEEARIKQYSDSIIVKTAHSFQRILDEASLFLHLVEEKEKQTKVIPRNGLGELNNVLKNKTALIADDDMRNIFSLTKALEQHQMKVLHAVDGKEALTVLAENTNIDVVLMDMMMPKLDGYQTIKEIRLNPTYKHLPILAVTAKAMMGDREKCIAAGASDYISKPVDVDQLISLLRVWLYDRV